MSASSIYVDFKNKTPKQQAEKMLDDILAKQAANPNIKQFGITYSANSLQTQYINNANSLSDLDGLNGANQAAVMRSMLDLLKDNPKSKYSNIKNKVKIIPITTMSGQYGLTPGELDEVADSDFKKAKAFANSPDNELLLWTNNKSGGYPAIGGGIARKGGVVSTSQNKLNSISNDLMMLQFSAPSASVASAHSSPLPLVSNSPVPPPPYDDVPSQSASSNLSAPSYVSSFSSPMIGSLPPPPAPSKTLPPPIIPAAASVQSWRARRAVIKNGSDSPAGNALAKILNKVRGEGFDASAMTLAHSRDPDGLHSAAPQVTINLGKSYMAEGFVKEMFGKRDIGVVHGDKVTLNWKGFQALLDCADFKLSEEEKTSLYKDVFVRPFNSSVDKDDIDNSSDNENDCSEDDEPSAAYAMR